MNSNAGKSSRCQLTENSQGQLAVFAIDLAPYGLRAGSHHNWHHAWVPIVFGIAFCRVAAAMRGPTSGRRIDGVVGRRPLHAHISSRDTSFPHRLDAKNGVLRADQPNLVAQITT